MRYFFCGLFGGILAGVTLFMAAPSYEALTGQEDYLEGRDATLLSSGFSLGTVIGLVLFIALGWYFLGGLV